MHIYRRTRHKETNDKCGENNQPNTQATILQNLPITKMNHTTHNVSKKLTQTGSNTTQPLTMSLLIFFKSTKHLPMESPFLKIKTGETTNNNTHYMYTKQCAHQTEINEHVAVHQTCQLKDKKKHTQTHTAQQPLPLTSCSNVCNALGCVVKWNEKCTVLLVFTD